jgi:hypothetical protein
MGNRERPLPGIYYTAYAARSLLQGIAIQLFRVHEQVFERPARPCAYTPRSGVRR